MNQQDNDIITISDLLVTLAKYFKLWLALTIIGVIMSIAYAVYHKNNYQYSANIVGPSYIENGSLHEIIPQNQLSQLVNIYYQQFRQLEQKQNTLVDHLNYEKEKSMLTTNAKGENMSQVVSLFYNFIQYVQKQEQYINRIQNWQNSVQFNLEKLEEQNKIYEQNVKQFQHNIDSLTTANDLASLNGQALLNNLSNMITSYQHQMFTNNIQIQNYQSQLQSLNKNITMLGGVLKSINPVGLTSVVIIILGMILTIILVTIVVFIIEFIRNTTFEVRQKLKTYDR